MHEGLKERVVGFTTSSGHESTNLWEDAPTEHVECLRENAEEATQGWAGLATPQDFSSPSDATTE